MPRYERSQFGCWTCRVRKKKCDEAYPLCTSCTTRGITCHGFGPKPEWVDGGDEERAVVDDLKHAIKENRRQKRLNSYGAAHPTLDSTPLDNGGTRNLPTPASIISTSTPLPHTKPSHLRFSPYCPLKYGTESILSPAESESEASLMSERDARELETTLLMNYFDHVFPFQFNCYTPPATELGRGWLLALLTRTKPLYHAALALSSFYMHSHLKRTDPMRRNRINLHWEQMKKHHTLAFKELQLQISSLSAGGTLTSTIETVAGIFQLISFEILRGGTDSWQIHLSAAATLVPRLATHLAASSFRPFSHATNEKYPTISTASQNKSATDHFPLSADSEHERPSNDTVASNFLVGALIWFDILSTASTSSPPYLTDNETYLKTHGIQLDSIMGCENWAMALISRVSALSAWKVERQAASCLSMRDLITRGLAIESELNEGLEKNKEGIGRSNFNPESSTCQRLGIVPSKTNLVITRIFAFSALTYLHTTISGAHPSLPEIQDSVINTIAAFKILPNKSLLRNLVWAFCVTGCLAEKQNEEFFRSAMESAKMGDRDCPGNLFKAWEVIQENWRMRGVQDGSAKEVGWVTAMDSLGFRVLLV